MTRTAAALALLLSPVLLHAQTNRPVYPAYDGFVQNPDGSYTLAFAYFSHNAEPVTIDPGASNSFSPDPGDRQQPTTFRPGHWRFQCVMVVGPDFDGKLRWNVAYGGTTTATSEKMLQSNWNLVEGAGDLKKIDYAKVPRGVCLNRPPTVRILGITANNRTLQATTTEPLSLFGSIADEGLPRNAKLTAAWKQMSGPAAVAFQDANMARTRATFAAPGSYELELTASDSVFTETTRVTVNVK